MERHLKDYIGKSLMAIEGSHYGLELIFSDQTKLEITATQEVYDGYEEGPFILEFHSEQRKQIHH